MRVYIPFLHLFHRKLHIHAHVPVCKTNCDSVVQAAWKRSPISVSKEEKKTYKSDIKFTAPQKSSGMYDRRHGDLESMTCPENEITGICLQVYVNIWLHFNHCTIIWIQNVGSPGLDSINAKIANIIHPFL